MNLSQARPNYGPMEPANLLHLATISQHKSRFHWDKSSHQTICLKIEDTNLDDNYLMFWWLSFRAKDSPHQRCLELSKELKWTRNYVRIRPNAAQKSFFTVRFEIPQLRLKLFWICTTWSLNKISLQCRTNSKPFLGNRLKILPLRWEQDLKTIESGLIHHCIEGANQE